MRDRSSREYAPGEAIFHEGNLALAVFCVGEGQVKLWRTAPHGDAHVMSTRGAGDLLGWRAVLTGGRYAVTAEPLRPSRICAIPRADFLDVVRDDVRLAFALLTRMALVSMEVENELLARSADHVRQRTARYLVGLMPGAVEDPSAPVDLHGLLPRHEMAQLIGTTPETLSRTLHVMLLRRILEADGEGIVVRDPEALRRIAR